MRARFAAKEGSCEAIEFVELVELVELGMDERDIFVRWSKFACSAANINPQNFSFNALLNTSRHKLRSSSSPRSSQIK
jgi:hypothetical protein